MNGEIKSFNPEDVTSPRLVYMKRGDQGYGFNLHGEKGLQGQTISAVDEGSPAHAGGLKEGDRVVEVNGVNVEKMKHGEVVKIIKQNPNETRLLVIDNITDKYLKENGRPISEDMANLKTVYEAPPEAVVEPSPAEPEVKEAENVETVAEVDDAPPTENEAEPLEEQGHNEQAPAPTVEKEPEPSPEIQQEDSPKDAIDEINNVLEQEEKKPTEPVVQVVPEPANRIPSKEMGKPELRTPERVKVKTAKKTFEERNRIFKEM